MSGIFERLAAGAVGLEQPQQQQEWSQAVSNAMQQVPRQEYCQRPNAPARSAAAVGCAGMGALMNRGVNQQQVMQGAGLNSLDPIELAGQQGTRDGRGDARGVVPGQPIPTGLAAESDHAEFS